MDQRPAPQSPPVHSHHDDGFRDHAQSLLSRFCGQAIFGLLALLLLVAPLAGGSVTLSAQGPLMIVVAVATVLWGVRLMVAREPRVVFSLLGAPLLVLGTYGVVRYTLADVESVARPDMLLVITSGLLFFLVLNCLRHRWQITTFAWLWTVLGSLLAVWGLGQVVRGNGGIDALLRHGAVSVPATGPFARASDLTVYLQIGFFVAVANFLFSRHALRQRIIFAFCAVILALGMVLAGVQTHWAGLIAGTGVVVLYVLRKRGWRFRWLIIGACVLAMVVSVTLAAAYTLRRPAGSAGAIASPMLNLTALEQLPGPESPPAIPAPEQPLLQLPAVWQSALAIGERHALLGGGPNMFRWLFATKRTVQGQPDYVSNTYLAIFTDYGLVGCALLVWVLVSFIISAAQILSLRATRYSAATASNRYAFAIGGLAAVTAVLVNAIFDVDLRVGGNLFTLTALMATVLTCGLHHHGKDDTIIHQAGKYTTLRLGGVSRVVIIIASLMFVILLGTRLQHSYPAYLFLRSAETERAQLNWATAEKAYLEAWHFDSRNFDVARALGDFYCTRATWNLPQRTVLADQALQWYNRALALNPYAYDVHVRVARLHDLTDHRQLATESYQRALQGDPHNLAYQLQLGLHYQRWDNDTEAVRCFQRVRTLARNDRISLE